MTKHMIAVGHTDATGKLVVNTGDASIRASIAVAKLQLANMAAVQQFGYAPPDAATGLAQHATVVAAATKAVKP